MSNEKVPTQETASPIDNPKESLPQGYRQGFLTAITVSLGFSLAFLRFWGFETTGAWYPTSILSAAIIGLSVLLQLIALYRSLSVEDDEVDHYRVSVNWFMGGVCLLVLGFVFSMFIF